LPEGTLVLAGATCWTDGSRPRGTSRVRWCRRAHAGGRRRPGRRRRV